MLKKVVEDIIFWLFLFTGLGENQVILLYVGFFPLNIMIVIGIFVDDLYQIEGIFLRILFASIQVIILVFPLPSQVIVYFPIIYCDILFSDILFSYILFSISVMKYISYLDLFSLFLQHLCLVLLLMVVS